MKDENILSDCYIRLADWLRNDNPKETTRIAIFEYICNKNQ